MYKYKLVLNTHLSSQVTEDGFYCVTESELFTLILKSRFWMSEDCFKEIKLINPMRTACVEAFSKLVNDTPLTTSDFAFYELEEAATRYLAIIKELNERFENKRHRYNFCAEDRLSVTDVFNIQVENPHDYSPALIELIKWLSTNFNSVFTVDYYVSEYEQANRYKLKIAQSEQIALVASQVIEMANQNPNQSIGVICNNQSMIELMDVELTRLASHLENPENARFVSDKQYSIDELTVIKYLLFAMNIASRRKATAADWRKLIMWRLNITVDVQGEFLHALERMPQGLELSAIDIYKLMKQMECPVVHVMQSTFKEWSLEIHYGRTAYPKTSYDYIQELLGRFRTDISMFKVGFEGEQYLYFERFIKEVDHFLRSENAFLSDKSSPFDPNDYAFELLDILRVLPKLTDIGFRRSIKRPNIHVIKPCTVSSHKFNTCFLVNTDQLSTDDLLYIESKTTESLIGIYAKRSPFVADKFKPISTPTSFFTKQLYLPDYIERRNDVKTPLSSIDYDFSKSTINNIECLKQRIPGGVAQLALYADSPSKAFMAYSVTPLAVSHMETEHGQIFYDQAIELCPQFKSFDKSKYLTASLHFNLHARRYGALKDEREFKDVENSFCSWVVNFNETKRVLLANPKKQFEYDSNTLNVSIDIIVKFKDIVGAYFIVDSESPHVIRRCLMNTVLYEAANKKVNFGDILIFNLETNKYVDAKPFMKLDTGEMTDDFELLKCSYSKWTKSLMNPCASAKGVNIDNLLGA
jgi:hypothetical protein